MDDVSNASPAGMPPRRLYGVPLQCALCGRHTPGHVAVRDGDGLIAQRLCSGHTLADVILSDRFDLAISVHHEEDAPDPGPCG